MPLWYKGIEEEHLAVRNAAGLFDVSHMGEFEVTGLEAQRFLQWLLPSDISQVTPGRGLYTLLCNEKGGIIDDIIVLAREPGKYLMIVNATRRDADLTWIRKHMEGFDVELKDVSNETALFALQGPRAKSILQPILDVDLDGLKRFGHVRASLGDIDLEISRTGYTGEDGFEIFVLNCPIESPAHAERVWELLLQKGRPEGLLPCGLGARDTLRLEAGLCLYGQDLNEDTTPLEARLEWVISWNKETFVGKDTLLRLKLQGFETVKTCFLVKTHGIPRSGYRITNGSENVGRFTSGTFSPLLRRGIGMGYLRTSLSTPGTEVLVELRGTTQPVVIVDAPFYDTNLYGWKRGRRT